MTSTIVDSFNNCMEEREQTNMLLIKKEMIRYEEEKKTIYKRFEKMIDYDYCIKLFIEWWIKMDKYCSQYNKKGHYVYLPNKIPIEVKNELQKIELTKSYLIEDDEIITPHYLTVLEKDYDKLILCNDLDIFCKVYNYDIKIDKEPVKIYWSN